MLLSLKTLHLAGTKKLRARFVGSFRVMEHIGKTACRLDLRGDLKISIMSSMYPSLEGTSLKAHLKTHVSLSK